MPCGRPPAAHDLGGGLHLCDRKRRRGGIRRSCRAHQQKGALRRFFPHAVGIAELNARKKPRFAGVLRSIVPKPSAPPKAERKQEREERRPDHEFRVAENSLFSRRHVSYRPRAATTA